MSKSSIYPWLITTAILIIIITLSFNIAPASVKGEPSSASILEPSLEEVLEHCGYDLSDFTELSRDVFVFPPGAYEVKLLAEWSIFHNRNYMGWYIEETGDYDVIFEGPEGRKWIMGYVKPPITKTFRLERDYGLFLHRKRLWPFPSRTFYTNKTKNPEKRPKIHVRVFKSKTEDLWLIGWEDLYIIKWEGLHDYQDMVIALKKLSGPPKIESLRLVNPSIGDKGCLSEKKPYTFETVVTDEDGDLSEVYLTLDPGGREVKLLWSSSSGFSIISNPDNYITALDGAVSHCDNRWTLHFDVTFSWDCEDWDNPTNPLNVSVTALDEYENHNESLFSGVYYVENDLVFSDLYVNDTRCNPGQTLLFSGKVYYEGTTIPPPDGNYHVTLRLGGEDKGYDYSLEGGAFLISAPAESEVKAYNYTVVCDHSKETGRFPTVIVDRLKIVSKGSTDDRTNVGETVYVYFVIKREYDDSFFNSSDGRVYINGVEATWNGAENRWELSDSHNNVCAQNYRVTDVEDVVYGITTVVDEVGAQEVIWDEIVTTWYDVSDSDGRCDVGSTQTIMVKLELRYDGTQLDGADVVYINGVKASYSSTGGYFYITHTESDVKSLEFSVSSAEETQYGITAFEETQTPPQLIWDRVDVTLSISDDRIDVGSTADIQISAVYAYDGKPFSGTVKLNDTLTKNDVGKYAYTTESIIDPLYGLTAFRSNTVYCTFDRVKITFFQAVDPRITVGETAQFVVKGVYEYDNKPWSGTYTLNDTTTKNTVGKYWFKIDSITDDNYGLTAFIQEPENVAVIWDRIEVYDYGTSDRDGRVDVGAQVVIWVKLRYEYDKEIFDSSKGAVEIGGKTATWDGTSQYWYITEVRNQIEKVDYETPSSFQDTAYGITAITGVVNQEVIWDKLRVTLSVTDDRCDVGSTQTISWKVTYQSDGKALTDFYIEIYRNDEPWYGGGESSMDDVSSEVCKYVYTCHSVLDNTYGLTEFDTNTVYIIWDKLVMHWEPNATELYVEEVVEVKISLYRSYDESEVSDFSLYIKRNETSFLDNFQQNSFTDSRTTPGVWEYALVKAVDNDYGLTTTEADPIIVRWAGRPASPAPHRPRGPVGGVLKPINMQKVALTFLFQNMEIIVLIAAIITAVAVKRFKND